MSGVRANLKGNIFWGLSEWANYATILKAALNFVLHAG